MNDVLLLSAGFGTRLGDLTKNTPKPLVEVAGKKLIERNLELLSKAGYRKVFINTHYLPEKIVDFVKNGSKWNLEIEYSHEKEILDTGGAVAKIAKQIKSKNLLILNSDIVIDSMFDFKDFTDFHKKTNSLASLVVRSDTASDLNGQLGLNQTNKLVKFLDLKIEENYKDVFFTGISLISEELLKKLDKVYKFSLTRDLYKSNIKNGELLSGYIMNSYWCDAGTPERLKEAENYLNRLNG